MAAKADLEDEVKMIKVPQTTFKDFTEVDQRNEEEFDYVVSALMINFLEQTTDHAMEFPPVLDSIGRARVHLLASFLGMGSHS